MATFSDGRGLAFGAGTTYDHCAALCAPPAAAMRPPPRRSAAVRLRTGETRIGRLLLPGLVLVFAAYVTFQLCQGLAAQAFAAARSAAASGAVGATPFRRDDLGSQAALGGALPSTRTAPAVVKAAAASDDRGTIHVMATSNGSPYLNYQTRIMYKTFTMARGPRRDKSSVGLGGAARTAAAAARCGLRAAALPRQRWRVRCAAVLRTRCRCAPGAAQRSIRLRATLR